MRVFSMLWALPLFLAGCGDKSAVSLSANITQGSVKVESGVFGASASGSFEMVLALGPEASGSQTVSPQDFQLLTQAKAVLVDQLPVVPEPGTSIPITIGKGESKTVDFAFMGVMVDHDTACAGPVNIVGAVDDATGTGSQRVTSSGLTPSCD